MSVKSTTLKTPRAMQKKLSKLSPFELKDNLISLAADSAKASTQIMLNAGRGNPNWIATTPREAFFALGQFAVTESRRVWSEPGLGGMPQKVGIASRLNAYLDKNSKVPGGDFLRDAVKYGVSHFKFNADAFVYELVDGIIGDQYPTPDRILKHNERIVQAYLDQEMCGHKPPKGQFDIFAVEGGTAAMCYIFDSLMQNKILKKGDGIALATPTFTPYIEIPELERYSFKVSHIDANEMDKESGRHTWQYTEKEVNKLLDPKIKAFFLVNPSNPPSVAVSPKIMKKIVQIVKTKRPDLVIITDDVYGTFVPGFRSLMADLPQNTIGVYSYSKYFGCTGWRLGVVAIHEKNIFDQHLVKLPSKDKKALNERYGSLTLEPEKIKFIDRMVADSRQVALNHTAGLSLPQQVQMTLFSLSALMDKDDKYKKLTQNIVQRRYKALWDGLGISMPADPLRAGYYCEIDVMVWAEKIHGPEFAKFLKTNYEPVDLLFRLAEQTSIVLMDGGGFAGPKWSVRVSLANLDDTAYAKIGKQMAEAAEGYVEAWQRSKGKSH
ncbi:bifunctional aspartate transaminase/aspartate 4-decarboxylase [Bdellovibrio svalbardensis]|uniref:Bifunctional aspartate transaminase/aspartate 4-decarboxylase n=1 Tax=Bdellovibrio svalbardensis TaxID=2972972 RepID=A0ABT6DQD4_9BACT|nr:bifunctional aspartate transaminase/aspartate 4-decarboxylase [Bdellovibrio svalbardensis]MDG0818270.1 bifunctional aspartate transaminase/aspartate 4-decarboxylase [Bdellovibrio svalbardensis]